MVLSEGLSKKRRLTEREQFVRFFSGSEVARLGVLDIFKVSNDQKIHRIGITIKGARISGFVRVSIKRIIREFFRKNVKPSPDGCDFNFVISPQNRNQKVARKKGELQNEIRWGTKEWLFQFRKAISQIDWKKVEFQPVKPQKKREPKKSDY